MSDEIVENDGITMDKVPKTMNLKIVFEEPCQTGTDSMMPGSKETIEMIEDFPIK